MEHASVLHMDDAYRDLNRHVLTPILDRFRVPPEKQKYLMPFYISGLMAIIRQWLKDDCADPIDHIISVIRDCIQGI